MRVSLKWLREYVPVAVSPDELAQRLTMAGLEVAEIYRYGENWENVYVGQIAEMKPHPNADRLQLVRVTYGAGREITVVTGARNLHVGDKVPLALVGARLVDTHVNPPEVRELKPVKLRGVLSEGMVCSEKELGLGEGHEGIMILDPEATVGSPLADELGDVILDLDVTPNRLDALSMIGVAREVSGLFDLPLRLPESPYASGERAIQDLVAVDIHDPDRCPRYTAAVIEGVAVKPSPKWLRDHLAAAGLRPINNVVDVTNFVMLEWGQPLHAFDYDRLRGHRIVVRRAAEGETITLLDGTERPLSGENLVIADAERPVALAGVMGGANSEVSAETRNVLIESANFDRVSVRRTAQALKLATDAAYRFERGLPRELPPIALERAVQMMLEVAGGAAARGIVDNYPLPKERPVIPLTTAEVTRLLGIEISQPELAALLRRVGCAVTPVDGRLDVVPPILRIDLSIPADLVEEVARLIGYDAIPSTLPGGRPPEPTINDEWRWKETIRETLVGMGFFEVATYPLTSRERLSRLRISAAVSESTDDANAAEGYATVLADQIRARFAPTDVEPLEIMNPLSRDSEVLRTSTFGSLLDTLRLNLRVTDRDVLLFEIGKLYLPRSGALPDERRILTVTTGEHRSSPTWGARIDNDYFWLKGVAENVLERLGVGRRVFRPIRHPLFHPARSAAILLRDAADGDLLVGVLGEVEPVVRATFDLDQPAYLLALDLERLLPRATRRRQIVPIQRFPPSTRDIALIVPSEVTSEDIEDLVREAGMPLVKAVDLFDIYQGPPIPAGKINLAYHVTYQAPDRTLTGDEVDAVQARIVRSLLDRFGAELRG